MPLLQKFGVDLPIGLEGAIGVSATVTEAADERTAKIALDLTPTTIEVPQLDWRKPAGQPST